MFPSKSLITLIQLNQFPFSGMETELCININDAYCFYEMAFTKTISIGAVVIFIHINSYVWSHVSEE